MTPISTAITITSLRETHKSIVSSFLEQNCHALVMKAICLFITISFFACNGNKSDTESARPSDTAARTIDSTLKREDKNDTDPSLPAKTYSNKRFKDVTVEKAGEDTFVIKGKAQIFEANFGWVVEDGHYELKKGYEMTDAGAPEWGKFKFTIEVQKQRPNSTLTLVLFESSAMDGSRQYELPVVLE